MRILVLGGTKFIGRHIVETLFAAGHSVTTFSRGSSPDELPAKVERLRGDRDQGPAGLSALKNRSWDVCIDVSGYTPRQVRAAAEMLSTGVERYVFISTAAVYAEPADCPVREAQALLPAASEEVTVVDNQTYGPLKVTCENIVQQVYANRGTVLRPQIVVGPHDPTGRYAHWVQRAARGGEMLAPGDGSDHLQVIDARDLARFVRTVVEGNREGIFNLAGPRFTWAEFMAMLGSQNVVWVPAKILEAANLTFNELPLFRLAGGARCSLMNVNNERALSAGLVLTDAMVTLRDFQAWIKDQPPVPMLPSEREAELIRIAKKSH